MSIRERSHTAYLRPDETHANVNEQKQLAKNDNDKPKTAFEKTVETIQAEYGEAQAAHAETSQNLEVLANDLKILWGEIEALGYQTRASAPLMEEYAAITAEQQGLLETKTELEQKMNRLQLEYEPFWALQESAVSIQSTSAEIQGLQSEQQTLHVEAENLRAEWAAHEVQAAEEQAKIDRDEEFIAGTQRALYENIAAINSEYQEHKRNPHAANDLRYLAYFDRAEQWLKAKGEEGAELTTKREALHTRRQSLKAEGRGILARYDACMERQVNVLQQLSDAELKLNAATATHQYGVSGVGESMQVRGTLSADQPAWVGSAQSNKEEISPDSYHVAA
jgi:hypothetical protein